MSDKIIKIDIISGFLGAGKTTLIKKLIAESLGNEKIVLIENEFGEIGIDGGFLKDAGIEITEMNSGCICCTLVGDFAVALKEVIKEYSPDRIIIEPSGVGKLSDVIKAVSDIGKEADNIRLNSYTTVADVTKAGMYIKNFGEFFGDQIKSANTIVLSRTKKVAEERLQKVISLLREYNKDASIVTTDWDELSGAQLLAAMEEMGDKKLLFTEEELKQTIHEEKHHHEHGCGCGCAHNHHDHHEHGCCGGKHHHHNHAADEVFESIGIETVKIFTKEELSKILEKLAWEEDFGIVLRAKGMLRSLDETWLEFDLTPGEFEIREGHTFVTGKLCIIGSKLEKKKIEELFL